MPSIPRRRGMRLVSRTATISDRHYTLKPSQDNAYGEVLQLTSNRWVTNSRTNKSLYGETSCTIIGNDTDTSDPHRKRVTGGILRSSSISDMFHW